MESRTLCVLQTDRVVGIYKSESRKLQWDIKQVRFMTQSLASQDASPIANPIAAGVVCPRCERRSLDASFCEHCQFELPQTTAASTTSGSGSPSGAIWSLASLGVCWPDDPSASFDVVSGPTAIRIRAIRPDLWGDLASDVRTRQSVALRALPHVHVLEVSGGALVLAEAWQPETIGVMSESATTVDGLLVETMHWCRRLDAALTELHASGHVWLEFDPEAVEFRGEQLRITNLDWRLFPHGRCPSRLARISPKYSPPEVCQFRDEFIGPRTDVFHLALSAYYRLAGLRFEGFAGRGLESFGFEVPPLRVFRPELPIGIWPVLRRALSINANHRPASTGELVQQLERAVEREMPRPSTTGLLNERSQSEPSLWQRMVRRITGEAPPESSGSPPQPTAIDVGWQTVAGRAKSALGAVNQDCAIVQREPVRDREVLLMIVADGVTHARVGAGDRASGLACEVLVASIREQIQACSADTEPVWPDILDRACQSASEAIVKEALSIPDRPAQISDNDLMSTTALIGVLDGGNLYLANVGDSRAYQVAGGIAEQLTVDGDVASSQLAAGTPPEQVQELGTAGKALRFCLGACREADGGQLVAELERARPQIGHWRIGQGDTFVLCSDGLVEERVFLEPEDLVRIVDAHRDPTSQGLAEQMVAAADARQRLPSETEPNGYGDNITCIVLRLVEGSPPHDASSRKG